MTAELSSYWSRATDPQARPTTAVPRLSARISGTGPTALLVHGTGSTSHSWNALVEPLGASLRLVAPDLPGHGSSENLGPGNFSPATMAEALVNLLDELGETPELVVGHSAGCAVLACALASRRLAPRGFIALNPAMLPFPGLQGVVLPGVARLLARTPLVAEYVALQGRDSGAVRGLLRGIGSRLETPAIDAYRQLFGDASHVRSVLQMMAEWDLPKVAALLPQLVLPCLLIGGARDRAVPALHLDQLLRRLPNAERVMLKDAGHLAHEEHPERVAQLMLDWCAKIGVIGH